MHAWPPPSHPDSATMTGLRLDAAALKVLAHPLRSRLLSALRVDGPATATALAARLGDQLRRHVLPPAQARVRRPGRGHRRGRGQAPALAGRRPTSTRGTPATSPATRTPRPPSTGWSATTPATSPSSSSSWLDVQDDLAGRVARRRRHERQLHRRHPRAGRGRCKAEIDELLLKYRRVGQGNPQATRMAVYCAIYPLDLDRVPTGKDAVMTTHLSPTAGRAGLPHRSARPAGSRSASSSASSPSWPASAA